MEFQETEQEEISYLEFGLLCAVDGDHLIAILMYFFIDFKRFIVSTSYTHAFHYKKLLRKLNSQITKKLRTSSPREKLSVLKIELSVPMTRTATLTPLILSYGKKGKLNFLKGSLKDCLSLLDQQIRKLIQFLLTQSSSILKKQVNRYVKLVSTQHNYITRIMCAGMTVPIRITR